MAEPLPNTPEFTVSELSYSIRRTIEDGFGQVRVRGEISGYRGPHSSGHAYFALKDEGAKIEAVIWRQAMARLRFKPEEGLEVIATGRVTTFPGGSKYQIVIDSLEPAGVGALMALLEERRRKLGAEGLFDTGRKKKLPFLPRVIGVVTSPTGAVIRDILHRLADRFPTRVLVWPVRVQGETSAREVAAAIEGFNALAPDGRIPRPDVLIVARGGGSLEDLWGFNEEIVVRAAAASRIPLVSAVGHETDWTLIDHAADLRAPTPTGAAEMVVPVRSELIGKIASLDGRLWQTTVRSMEARRNALRSAVRALGSPESFLSTRRQRLDLAAGRLSQALGEATRIHATRFARASARLSPDLLARALRLGRERLDRLGDRSLRAVAVLGERRSAALARLSGRLRAEPLFARLERGAERADGLGRRLDAAFLRQVERRRDRLDAAGRLLATLSYKAVLARGFVLVAGPDGRPVRSAAALAPGDGVALEFADGRVRATVDGADAGGPPGPVGAAPEPGAPARPAAAARPRRRESRSGEQGSLF
ncbi:exodeoxyribonuclease VII large subunit [Prosthecomicrobium hirschii]|uniref:Exodeoxyribonuclease 7 large subunit n=1 Tax=Prosthecodimorpha hirschii TaxID=665126 RepID=A0A0N8GFG8_9HYPH|nr:exodeoxyribonuclease VII large subunit [Prosthecomicrobium hirschii]KPL54281.1 exodeoxyribonuclease VII large subunit [Prosthecomicrobium hirschii]